MFDLNPHLHPPGGYVFNESDGMTITAADLASLVAAVAEYRTRSGLPAGEPRREIPAQICQRTPQVCREVPFIPLEPTPEQKALVKRVVESTKKFSVSSLRFVKSPEAYARANACKGCPRLKEWSRFCPPCKANAVALLSAAIGNRELVGSVSGCACDLAGDDVSAAVWIEDGERLNDAPEHCWRAKGEDDV